MTSYAKFDVWQDTQGVTKGAVINMYYQSYDNWNVVFNADQWYALNTITLTPVSTESRFILIPCYHASGKGGFRILKNGSEFTYNGPLDSSSLTYQNWNSTTQADWNANATRQWVNFTVLDSPNTTSAITYIIQARSYWYNDSNQRMGINETGVGGYTTTYRGSGFTIMEFAK